MTAIRANMVGPRCFDHQHQGPDRGLPFRQSGFLLWEAGYVIACLPQGDQLAIRQYNWFVELARP